MSAADETEAQPRPSLSDSPQVAGSGTPGASVEESEGGIRQENGALLELSPEEELGALEHKVDASPSASRSNTILYPFVNSPYIEQISGHLRRMVGYCTFPV